VESKWKNYHINTFSGQPFSKNTGNVRDASARKLRIALFGELSLEEAMDLLQDRLLLETSLLGRGSCVHVQRIKNALRGGQQRHIYS
jgi:hypothetical protein